MKALSKLGMVAIGLLAATAVACGGNDGAPGKDGAAGPPGPAGPTGPTGPAGTGTTPSVSSIFPHYGLLDRDLDVVVTAEAVTFDASSTVDFGAGITVTNPVVISPTSLFVHLKVDKAAAVGPRDVKVVAGTNNLTGTKAFAVSPAMTVKVAGGNVKQGGVFVADLYNLDHTAFDTTSNPFTGASNLEFASLVSVFPWGSAMAPTTTNAKLALLVDPLAPATRAPLVAGNAALDGTIGTSFISNPDALNIAATTPTALTIGTAKVDVLSAPYATNLYKFSTPGAAIVHTTFTNAPTALISPVINVYPSSGVFADILTSQSASFFGPPGDTIFAATSAQDSYVIVGDTALQGGSAAEFGYSFTVTSTPVAAANVIAESATAHGKVSTAQPIPGLPAIITGSTTATATVPEFDLYSFTAAAGDLYEVTITGYGDQSLRLAPAGAGDQIDFANAIANVQVPLPQHNTSTVATAVVTAGPMYLTVIGLYGGPHPAGKYTISIRKTN